MNCPTEEQWLAFLEGSATATQKLGFEAHLDECAHCRKLTAAIVRDRADVDAPPRSQPALSSSGALLKGAALGRYQLIERLGEGGMGVVYAAYDPKLDRQVAIKVIKNGAGAGREDEHQRLLAEAKALAKVSHRNVITVHDVGTFDDQVYIAMELIPNAITLRRFSKTHSWQEVFTKLLLAANGVRAAHRAGIAHGDFKPDNVLISPDTGQTVVTDFGLAHPILDDLGATAVSSGRDDVVRGTPNYMAPEQFETQRATPLSDQYAFCQTARELLFGGDKKGAPAALETVLKRGLATEPTARFASFDELMAQLKAVPRSRRRRLVLLGVLAPLSLLAIGLGTSHLEKRAHHERCAAASEQLHEALTKRDAFASHASPVYSGGVTTSGFETLVVLKRRVAEYRSNLEHLAASACRDGNLEAQACLQAAGAQLVHVNALLERRWNDNVLRVGTRITEALVPLKLCSNLKWATLACTSEREADLLMRVNASFSDVPTPGARSNDDARFDRTFAEAQGGAKPDVVVSLAAWRALYLARSKRLDEAQKWLDFAGTQMGDRRSPCLRAQLERGAGAISFANDDLQATRTHLTTALELSKQAFSTDDTRIAVAESDLIERLEGQHMTTTAGRALGVIQANENANHPDQLPLLVMLARESDFMPMGGGDSLESLQDRIATVARKAYGDSPATLAKWLLIDAQLSLNQFGRVRPQTKAIGWAEEALELYQKAFHTENARQAQLVLVELMKASPDQERVQQLCTRLYENWSFERAQALPGDQRVPPSDDQVGQLAACVGRGLVNRGAFEESLPLLEKALELMSAQNPHRPRVEATWRALHSEPPKPKPVEYSEDVKQAMKTAAAAGMTYVPGLGVVAAPNVTVKWESQESASRLNVFLQRRFDKLRAKAAKGDVEASTELRHMRQQATEDEERRTEAAFRHEVSKERMKVLRMLNHSAALSANDVTDTVARMKKALEARAVQSDAGVRPQRP